MEITWFHPIDFNLFPLPWQGSVLCRKPKAKHGAWLMSIPTASPSYVIPTCWSLWFGSGKASKKSKQEKQRVSEKYCTSTIIRWLCAQLASQVFKVDSWGKESSPSLIPFSFSLLIPLIRTPIAQSMPLLQCL